MDKTRADSGSASALCILAVGAGKKTVLYVDRNPLPMVVLKKYAHSCRERVAFMKNKLLTAFLIIMMAGTLVSCGSGDAKVIAENESANKDYIKAAVAVMDGETLALQDKLDWGAMYSDVKDVVKEPYIDDSSQYVSRAFYAKLPSGEGWADAEGNLQPDQFASMDILAYYVMDSDIGLYEYGYLAPDANLYQYDFLKEYYMKKYGEPEREDWEWKNDSHTDTDSDDEDKYQLFADGYVRVMTVWDIEELDTVLVVDWLNDPVKYNNNYGQISFYKRAEDFSVDSEDDLEDGGEEESADE